MASDEKRSVILLDTARGTGQFDKSILERIGHTVTVCNGPQGGQACPLLGGQGCELYEDAHGVVFELDLDRPDHRAILERYRELREDLPIRVVVTDEQANRYGALLADVEIWTHDPNVADLDGFAAEVEAADRFA